MRERFRGTAISGGDKEWGLPSTAFIWAWRVPSSAIVSCCSIKLGELQIDFVQSAQCLRHSCGSEGGQQSRDSLQGPCPVTRQWQLFNSSTSERNPRSHSCHHELSAGSSSHSPGTCLKLCCLCQTSQHSKMSLCTWQGTPGAGAPPAVAWGAPLACHVWGSAFLPPISFSFSKTCFNTAACAGIPEVIGPSVWERC